MKTLAELREECDALGIPVRCRGRASKEVYVAALREHHWNKDHPGEPRPPHVEPMLLGDWGDLDPADAEEIEEGGSGWLAQPKLDGVRAMLHVEAGRVRVTSRHVSVVNYRQAEFQDNVPHLIAGFGHLEGTVLDGELCCPVRSVETGGTTTAHPLQAATAILATSPQSAHAIQERHGAWLRFHAFDVLRDRGEDVTSLPLLGRLDRLARALADAANPYLVEVPSFTVGKGEVHRRIIESGGEGTVWKRLEGRYEPGRRVRHWLKRKAEVRLEAFVTGFKAGEPGNGHALLVGAVEFSARGPDGRVSPVAWVSSWSDAERQAMTVRDLEGAVHLKPSYLGRGAMIAGQDLAAKSRRLRHARFLRWIGC